MKDYPINITLSGTKHYVSVQDALNLVGIIHEQVEDLLLG